MCFREEEGRRRTKRTNITFPSTWDIPLSVKTFMEDDRATDPHNEYDIENIADDYVDSITRYFDTIPYAIFEICTFKIISEEALVFLKKHNAIKLANVYMQALVIIRDKRKKNSPANVLALDNIRRKLWGTVRAKMRPSLGRYIRTLEAANFFMYHSAKVMCAICQKKHVGCIRHPLEKRKSRWPNNTSGASRRPTFLTPSSLWTGESTPERYSSRSSIKRLKAQLEAKKAKEALQLQQTKWSCVCECVCECVYMWTCQIVFIFTVSE